MSEKGSEPDIEARRFNVAEVPLADAATHKIKARFVETMGAPMALIFPVRSIS
jgi:hypothetical protein